MFRRPQPCIRAFVKTVSPDKLSSAQPTNIGIYFVTLRRKTFGDNRYEEIQCACSGFAASFHGLGTGPDRYKEDEDGYTTAAAPVHRFGSDLSPSQIQSSLENDRLIEDAAKDWGLPCNPGNMVKARDLAREYSIQWLIEAMKRAGNGKSQTWAYVEGILRSFKANGGPDTPGSGHRVVYPEKRVSAQNYQQRQYTEAELMAVSGDLVAEARKLREEMPKARTQEEQAAFEAEQESDIAAFLQKEAGA